MTATAQTSSRIPFYAEPYYNYEPLKITIGKYQKELLSNSSAAILALAERIKADMVHRYSIHIFSGYSPVGSGQKR
jgi:hypothetical protein